MTTLTPTLTWNVSSGATAYLVAVSQVGGGTVLATNVKTNSVICPTLTNGASYLWAVSASNSAGSSPTSAVVYFTVMTVPPTPTGLSPGGSSLPGPTVTTLTLTWNVSSGATAYSVAVSQVGGGTVLATNVKTNSVICPTLTNGASYLWAVSASNSAGSSPTSAVVYFTVNVATVPQAPTLDAPGSTTSPGPAISNLTPTFVWNASSGATNYGLYVRDVNTNVLVYNNDYLGNITSLVMPSGTLVAGHNYVWNMRASNSAGFSGYSTQFYFQEQAVPPTPTGLSPGGSSLPGPTVTTLTPTLTWNVSSGATAYSVAVSQVGGGTVLATNVTTNSVICPTLAYGASYLWAVSASNSAGSSPTSAVVYFTVNKFYIGEYVKVSGTGGAGLNLRSCANTSCSVLVNMPDGTVMQVIGGPTVAAGYTWWNLSGTVAGVSHTGWAIQDYLIVD